MLAKEADRGQQSKQLPSDLVLHGILAAKADWR